MSWPESILAYILYIFRFQPRQTIFNIFSNNSSIRVDKLEKYIQLPLGEYYMAFVLFLTNYKVESDIHFLIKWCFVSKTALQDFS